MEGVQVYARHQRVGTRADRQLNVQEHRAFNLVEQIAQVVAQARAEHAHLLGEGAQTLQARRGEAAATVVLAVERFAVRAVLRQVLDCLDERNVPRGVVHRALEHLVQLLLGGAQMLGGQTAAGTPAGTLGGAVLCVLDLFGLLEQAQGHLLPQGPLTLANQRLRPIPQRQQVGTAQAPAGTREQAGQRIRTVRVGQHAQRRDQVHDLRLREQATQAHLLHRNVQALALLTNCVQLAVGAGQHGDLGHLQARTHRTVAAEVRRVGPFVLVHGLGAHPGNPLGNARGLRAVGVVVGHLHATGHPGGGFLEGGSAFLPDQHAARAQVGHLIGADIATHRAHPLGNVLELFGHVVRRVQDRDVVTPRHGQEERLRVRGREVTVEAEHLAVGGAAEAVNRLLRVTHRHHGVRGNTGRLIGSVNRGEQAHLRVGGVLELIQQNHLEAGALPLANRGVALGDARGQAHKVTEVQHLHARLHAGVALRHLRVHPAVTQESLNLLNVPFFLDGAARIGHRGVGGQLLGAEVDDLLRLAQVLGALVGKLQQLVNHGGRREGHITLILR